MYAPLAPCGARVLADSQDLVGRTSHSTATGLATDHPPWIARAPCAPRHGVQVVRLRMKLLQAALLHHEYPLNSIHGRVP